MGKTGQNNADLREELTALRQRLAALEAANAERMALVGQLVSGLAHAIGTPLGIIAGNAELLRLELQEHGDQTSALDTIIEQAAQITHLIEQLLAFARTRECPMGPVAIYGPLSQALQSLTAQFNHQGVTVHADLPPDLPPVWGVAEQLEQVFLNVLANAVHAMPNGGTLTIRAELIPDRRLRLTLHDTGMGMSAKDLVHAFEPFYTTRGSKGTGLGLAICKQIIDRHGGSICLQSTLGLGTTVTIELLLAEAARCQG